MSSNSSKFLENRRFQDKNKTSVNKELYLVHENHIKQITEIKIKDNFLFLHHHHPTHLPRNHWSVRSISGVAWGKNLVVQFGLCNIKSSPRGDKWHHVVLCGLKTKKRIISISLRHL